MVTHSSGSSRWRWLACSWQRRASCDGALAAVSTAGACATQWQVCRRGAVGSEPHPRRWLLHVDLPGGVVPRRSRLCVVVCIHQQLGAGVVWLSFVCVCTCVLCGRLFGCVGLPVLGYILHRDLRNLPNLCMRLRPRPCTWLVPCRRRLGFNT